MGFWARWPESTRSKGVNGGYDHLERDEHRGHGPGKLLHDTPPVASLMDDFYLQF